MTLRRRRMLAALLALALCLSLLPMSALAAPARRPVQREA